MNQRTVFFELDPLILAFLVASFIVILAFWVKNFSENSGLRHRFTVCVRPFAGPVFQIFEWEILISITPYFVALALVTVLFDGGANMDKSRM